MRGISIREDSIASGNKNVGTEITEAKSRDGHVSSSFFLPKYC